MADTSKQIKDLIEATSVNNDDLFLVQANDDNCRKVTKETLLREINADKTTILNTIGTENMGTTATTLKGAISEHEGQINTVTSQLNDIVNNNLDYSVKNFKCDDGEYVKGDGIHDDTSGIQNAINYLRNKTLEIGDINGIYTLSFPAGNYKITKTLEFSPLVKIRSIGYCVISSNVNGTAIKLIAKDTDLEDGGLSLLRDWYGGKYIDGSSGFLLKYIGDNNRNSIALEVGNNCDVGKSKGFMFGNIDGLRVNGFETSLQINPVNVYCVTFENCTFPSFNYGIGVRVGNDVDNINVNSGERITFKNCQFGNIVWYKSLSFNFLNCSFDYAKCVFYSPNNKDYINVYCNGCWFEGMSTNITDEDVNNGIPYGLIYGNFKYSTFVIENSTFVLTNTRRLFNYISYISTNYRLILKDIKCSHIHNNLFNYDTMYMCDDNIRVVAERIYNYIGYIGGFVSRKLNLLSEPSFNSLNEGSVTTTTGSLLGSYSIKWRTGLKDSEIKIENGIKILKFITTDINNSIVLQSEKINVNAGDTIQINSLYKGFDILKITLYYFDKNGIEIGNSGNFAMETEHSLSEWYFSKYNKIETIPARCTNIEVKFDFGSNNSKLIIGSEVGIKELVVQKC